jgi:hypothetical protein
MDKFVGWGEGDDSMGIASEMVAATPVENGNESSFSSSSNFK